MIKNIIFDIGNVLTVFCWEKFMKSFGYSEEVFEKIANASARNDAWNEFDRGVLTAEEVVDLFVKNEPSVEKEIRHVFEDIGAILERCDYAIPWILDLKKAGYKVYYLSNFFRKAEVECAGALDFIPYMDGGILSYKEKLIKPDAPIYELLMERYGLEASECVFLDDREINCEGARNVGMKAICFKNQTQAIEELKTMGVEA